MTNDEKELVEEIATWLRVNFTETEESMSENLLLIIKANIGKIAEVCDCINTDLTQEYGEAVFNGDCKICHGTGITPKGK